MSHAHSTRPPDTSHDPPSMTAKETSELEAPVGDISRARGGGKSGRREGHGGTVVGQKRKGIQSRVQARARVWLSSHS